jgi:uncharacterized protein (TIGR03435 family)
MRAMLTVFVAAFLVTTPAVRLLGQGLTDRKPLAFEVASVKPTVGREPVSVEFQPGGRFRAINADVFSLIALSYARGALPFFPSQIVGAPEWTRLEHYDITAKVSDQLAATDAAGLQAKLPAFIQTLLENRFKLRVHRENREQQIYVLQRARKDGAFGPTLRRGVDCAPNAAVDALSSFLGDCRLGARVTPGHITGRSIPLAQLVTLLSLSVGRAVVDETGLEGVFEVDLEWSPDQAATDKPSLFTAIQEQLGLKLESTRRSADVLVIERVERPMPD